MAQCYSVQLGKEEQECNLLCPAYSIIVRHSPGDRLACADFSLVC